MKAGRPSYRIESAEDAALAKAWIRRKIAARELSSVDGAGTLARAQTPAEIHDWCEAYLSSQQWQRLRASIRKGRSRRRANRRSVVNQDVGITIKGSARG